MAESTKPSWKTINVSTLPGYSISTQGESTGTTIARFLNDRKLKPGEVIFMSEGMGNAVELIFWSAQP